MKSSDFGYVAYLFGLFVEYFVEFYYIGFGGWDRLVGICDAMLDDCVKDFNYLFEACWGGR